MADGPFLDIKFGRFQARAVGWPAIGALILIAAGQPFLSLVIWACGSRGDQAGGQRPFCRWYFFVIHRRFHWRLANYAAAIIR
jgi:hypothetical protein